jgi:hypothetical protein
MTTKSKPYGNVFIDYLGEDQFTNFENFAKTHKRQKLQNAESKSQGDSSSTKEEGSFDPKEQKRIAAKNKRREVSDKLRRKRAKKEAEKIKESSEEESSPVEANKKKDTIWKIIMPGKERMNATNYELQVVEEIESLIDKQPLVQKSLQ